MAQTKRKRRNKHRGNAVGVVEARGRTSKPREGQPRKASGARGAAAARPLKEPTLKNSALKALIGASILFIFFTVTDKSRGPLGALVFCLFAVVLYTPVMFWTDKWVYRRNPQQQAAGGAGARGRS